MISSSLFHYTSFDNLIQIIKDQKFITGFNYEPIHDLGFKSANFLLAPMVCFCDIPMSFIGRDKFGEGKNHAIAMSKNWRDMQDLNPILYRRIDSSYSSIFQRKVKSLENLERTIQILGEEEKRALNLKAKKSEIEDSRTEDEIIRIIQTTRGDMLQHTDNLKELFIAEALLTNNFAYYEEREWRFVDSSRVTLTKNRPSAEEEEKKKQILNKNLRDKKSIKVLDFKIEDIKHLIVPNDAEKKRLISALIDLQQSDDQVELISKIISLETIEMDL